MYKGEKMSKSDYWNEKEHEKYERMKVVIDLDDFDFENAKKISKITNRIIKAITIPAIIIGVATFIIIFLGTILYWRGIHRQLDPDIIGNLESIYNEKFTIISEGRNGNAITYKMSPESNNKIVFTAYKNGGNVSDDYQSRAYKYFVENIIDEDIRKELVVDSREDTIYGEKILYYNTYLEPNNFGKIDECVENIYKIREKAEQQKQTVYLYITTCSMIKINNYHSQIQYTNGDSLENLKIQEKYAYINFVKQNNLDDTDIPKEELENHKPLYLHAIVNGESMQERIGETLEAFYSAEYNPVEKEYKINLASLFKCSEKFNTHRNLSGTIDYFKYNGKKYKVAYGTSKAKGNSIPLECYVTYLQQYFDANIKFDYDNKIIYIEL